jgi:hypothetical protein
MSVNLPSFPPSASGRPQRLLKRLSAPAALAVSALAFVSSASAAECVNGYRMLGNQVIVLCDEASEAQAFYQPGAYWTYYLDSGEVSLACQ